MYRKNYKPSMLERSCSQLDSIPVSKEEYRRKVEANYMDNEGCTNLHLAVYQESDSMIERAIKAGCNVNTKDKYGRQAIHIAADRGQSSSIRRLLMHGSDVNGFTDEGHSPLMLCARKGHIAALRSLLHGGAKVNVCNERHETALHYAMGSGIIECIDVLINFKANINAQDLEGNTPLMVATKCGQMNAVKHIISAKAKKNLASKAGYTAVHLAVEYKHDDILKFLIQEKADIEIKTKADMTPFVLSINCDNSTALKALLDANCDRSIDGLNGTCLALASIKGHNNCLKVLLEVGEDPDELGFCGITPVMAAVFESHIDILDTLLNAGADPDIRSRTGCTAVHKCLMHLTSKNVHKRHLALIKLVRANVDMSQRVPSAGVYTNITNGRNCSLSFAINSGYISLVKIILLAGSDVQGGEVCEWAKEGNASFLYDVQQLLNPIRDWLLNPLPLKHMCRLAIRGTLGTLPKSKIENLPIANPLKKYVDYDDLDSIPVEQANVVGDMPHGFQELLHVRPCGGLRGLEGTLLHQSMGANGNGLRHM